MKSIIFATLAASAAAFAPAVHVGQATNHPHNNIIKYFTIPTQ